MTKNKVIQLISEVLFVFFAVVLLLNRYWESAKSNTVFYALLGGLGLAVTAACFIYGALYRDIDTWLIILFFFFTYVTTVVNYGFSGSVRIRRFFCIWAGVFALYFMIRTVPEGRRLMKVFSTVSVLPLGYTCVSVILNASHAICKEVPPHDTFRGCFDMGRLCGLDNANHMGFLCTALILIALYGFLSSGKWFRVYFAAAALLGWFSLGLTNCRTGIIAVTLATGLFIFLCLRKKFLMGNAPATVLKWVCAILLSLAAAALIMLTFYLPTLIYRLAAEIYGRLKGNAFLLVNITRLDARVLVDEESAADRMLIWKQSLHTIFSSPRRWLFGISPVYAEYVTGVYEGHHEIMVSHSHNILIEVLRKYGVIGLGIWLALILRWYVAWIGTLTPAFKADPPRLFMVSAIAGMLIMGVTEPLPLLASGLLWIAVPFVVFCGFLIRKRSCVNE